MMLHATKGIVLRTVKYGETSLIVLILTEKFGIQSYIVNGVRISSRKGGGKASFFQPASILDMVVYHNELKNIQRIREFKWSHLYRNVFSDVIKNAVALFMVELLTRSLKQPETHPELFQFAEDAFLHLDEADSMVTANFPLFFSLHLAVLLGFRMSDNYSAANPFFDLQEGKFITARPHHLHFLEDRQAEVTSLILKVMQPQELEGIKLNHDFRRSLLKAYETYFALHIQDFGTLKSLPVLGEILN
jgi:DNA repair protein RecO (recombination protein O)